MPGNESITSAVKETFRFPARAIAGLMFILAVQTPAVASNFSITPTTLELSGSVKSGAFSIVNGGTDTLNCQITVKEWGQDPDGKDVYADAKDIVVFPKIMTVAPNEQRAVRIGVKGPPSQREKTYRLFAEEMPAQKKASDVDPTGKISAGLTIAFRYAVPIFVKPLRPQESAIIEKTGISKSAAGAVVRNTGNIHIKILSVTFRGKSADGKELFSQEVAGWYVLQGLSRSFETPVPREVCQRLSTIDVSAQAENMTMNGTMNVQKSMCGQ